MPDPAAIAPSFVNSIVRRCALPMIVLVALAYGVSASAATPKLKVSDNGRFLIQSNGTPFFWMGDTNWRLYKLSQNEIDAYLDDRQSKDFNVIQGPVLLQDSDHPDGDNADGETNTNPSNPNGAWFNHIDYIVDAAKQRDMYVALVAVWGDDWELFDSNTEAREYGQYLGNRYKNDKNVIWIVAGEYLIEGTGSTIMNRWKYLAKGLEEGGIGYNLITIHGSFQEDRQSSSVKFHSASWLDFNMIQSSQSGNGGEGAENWKLITIDRKKDPAKPTLDAEATYEGWGGWDGFGVRRRAYWSVFAGAFGHGYGANGVWQSYQGSGDDGEGGPQDTWDAALDYAGAADMKHLRRLMESRPMLKRGPAQSLLVSNAGGVPDHMQGTRDSSGRFAMIYVPDSNRTFTVDMSKIDGSQAKAWWYDPRNGEADSIGTFSTSQPQTFTTPNSGEDWVLVLDKKSKNYPPPGEGGPLP